MHTPSSSAAIQHRKGDLAPKMFYACICTHLLYTHVCVKSDAIVNFQVAKGGEADDALKRVMLDFHTTQLVAQKQALIVLLSGKCWSVFCFSRLSLISSRGLLHSRLPSTALNTCSAPLQMVFTEATHHCSPCPNRQANIIAFCAGIAQPHV